MRSISIALTTYNGEKFLRQQLDSIRAQSIPFTELVVCDDCSNDSTRDILMEYAQADNRIRVVFNESNLGFKANFEKAIRLCSGDLIALADQDDIWLPDHLKILADGIGDKLLVGADAELIDSAGNSLDCRLSAVKNFRKPDFDCNSVFRFIAYYQNPFQGASMMFRREFIDIALPIPHNVKYHDVWFALIASAMDSFAYIDVPVTLYRMHGGNASGEHKHHWTVRTVAGHFLKKNLGNNRKSVIEALTQNNNIKDCNPLLLTEAVSYFRNRSFATRLRNLFFEIKNYSSIYGNS